MTTLKDVSIAAGVSVMTVSNVIRGRTGAVSDKTRERIEKEIKRLNYWPNVSAQNLRASASRSIGMVISDNDPAFLSDPFISQLVSGLSNVLSSNDYSLDIQGIVPEHFGEANILSKASNEFQFSGVATIVWSTSYHPSARLAFHYCHTPIGCGTVDSRSMASDINTA